MNKYIKEAQEKNKGRFEPETFEDYCNMHPADAKRVSMAHIRKLKDEFVNSKSDDSNKNLDGESNFVKNPIKWD